MMEKMSQKTRHTSSTLKMDGMAYIRAFTTIWKEGGENKLFQKEGKKIIIIIILFLIPNSSSQHLLFAQQLLQQTESFPQRRLFAAPLLTFSPWLIS